MTNDSPKPPRSPDPGTLTAKYAAPAYTPKAQAAPQLVAELAGSVAAGDEALTAAIEKALLRIPEAASPHVAEALRQASRPLRGELTDLAGRLARTPGGQNLKTLLLELVTDQDLKTQLNAIKALARLPEKASETVLLKLLETQPRREVRLALIRALGMAGGDQAREALARVTIAGLGATRAPETQALERAKLILRRETSRTQSSGVAGAARLPEAVPMRLHVRRGLEELAIAEAAAAGLAGVRREAPGILTLRTAGPLAALRSLRLVERIGVPVEPRTGDPLAAAAAGIAAAAPLIRALTLGAVRFRIDWPGVGDALVWSLVQRLTEAAPDLVNDPTSSTWEVHIRVLKGQTHLEWEPRRLADDRFTYRRGYVYAASHPTLAAALARVAGTCEGDIVWDPFLGSGTELIERARLGSTSALYGTDLDPQAVATAEANLRAAEVTTRSVLTVGSALDFYAVRPTLIISNPPMGRRVQRGTLVPLIERFVQHAAERLAPGGRLVWLSPLPAETAEAFTKLGLKLTLRQTVDMGGFDAELQSVEKPADAKP